ncbi:coiled-coil-helix-coiled-coil-helix domain-containing protein 1-like [Asterias rubens]|uniref:coiled-coil-helix-coiled-coil-helix domain-containing protein 1-like n=1 Tax=Asterias rubens TaxID=7604 RepID=UPI001455A89F|nr:coiled-coil-helix-coiled-coil-helix domain-containing protein 1-like [Asterias rubens]
MSKRMNEIILRNNYKPSKFVHMQRDFRLRDKVALRRNRPGAAECITEMSVLMACWKKNEFNDSDCTEEIKIFHSCCAEAEKTKKAAIASEKSGKVGAGKMTSKQVTSLLQKYPQPR